MSENKRQKNPFQAMAIMSAITSNLAGSILVGIFLGKWLDRSFDTFPLFLIIGLLLGLATGVYGTIRIIQRFLGEDK